VTNQQKARLLLVEDSEATARIYQEYLRTLAVDVTHVSKGRAGLDLIRQEDPDVLLLDLNLPDIHGLELMAQLKKMSQNPIIIVITAHGSVDMAVQAMRAGAFDFLQKPFNAERLRVTVRNAMEGQNLKALVKTYQDSFERNSFHGFIGSSIPIQAVYRLIESAASSHASVFITGESGSGKEVCADAIHNEGNRKEQPFIAVNCAAIPQDLMESAIFGHVKGAFTGASSNRKGAATMADEGTLFLDEIGEMPLAMQSKLLRFIQTKTFQKVGNNKMEKVNVRFVCATNQDPLEMVKGRTLREDLYYRLHVIPIHMPPLRKCRDDIMLIARKYLKDYSAEEGGNFKDFSVNAVQLITRYHWPGNVRQLQNIIRNIVVLQEGEIITSNMLPTLMNGGSNEISAHSPGLQTEFNHAPVSKQTIKPLWLTEKLAIENAVDECGGNIPRAAAMLDISPSTIYRKLQSWEGE
jgi:two-component system repressor protein LuxO